MPGRALNRKPKILYIEDNPENRMLVRAVLEAAGYDLVEAEDGLAGIEAAIREEPALILLDINLPGVDGYEIVAILKSFANLASTPVIAVAAYAMQGDRQRTLVAGCHGNIQKPSDVDAAPRRAAEFRGGSRERAASHDEGLYVRRDTDVQPRSVLTGSGVSAADDWTEVEWRLPLTVRGRQLGVMIARHVLPPGAKADEEQLLKIVADQVAIAVENARLYEGVMRLHEETQERLRHTETLLAMSQDASATLELNEILRRTTRAMVRALGADTGA